MVVAVPGVVSFPGESLGFLLDMGVSFPDMLVRSSGKTFCTLCCFCRSRSRVIFTVSYMI